MLLSITNGHILVLFKSLILDLLRLICIKKIDKKLSASEKLSFDCATCQHGHSCERCSSVISTTNQSVRLSVCLSVTRQ